MVKDLADVSRLFGIERVTCELHPERWVGHGVELNDGDDEVDHVTGEELVPGSAW